MQRKRARALESQAIWLKGTGYVIAALVTRVLRGQDNLYNIYDDLSTAFSLVQQSVFAQEQLGMGKTAGGRAILQEAWWPRPA